MLRTPSKPTLQLEGINQQDFNELQLVQGCFPFQIGLQKRIPGKTLLEQHPTPIGSIYVFYMVYGRHYQLLDFGDGIQIDETVIPPITLPGLPIAGNSWIDTFAGYPDALLSRLWGAGIWPGTVGICETLIAGYIDPFLVYATIPKTPLPEEGKPKPLPPPESDPDIPPGSSDPSIIWGPGAQPQVIIYWYGLIGQIVANLDVDAPVVHRFDGSTFVLGAGSLSPGETYTAAGITVGRGADKFVFTVETFNDGYTPRDLHVYLKADGSIDHITDTPLIP
jgi:hypothetical protein